jgi:two-component system response regulator MprA
METARILIVEDDEAVLEGLRRALTVAGFRAETAGDGEEVLAKAKAHEFDLILLDVMLPGLDGLTVTRRLRETSTAPILMVTARDTIPDRVAGLEAGADDYLVKPFAVDELIARIRALLRRARPDGEDTLSYADLRLDARTREVTRGDAPISLTSLEFDLLHEFMRHPRQVMTRDRLLERVWGYDYRGGSNIVDSLVRELRKKLNVSGRTDLIQTVRGYGYALREE